MEEYDVIVIGSGAGMNIVENAIGHNLKTALVDKGPLGGTCPNLGCIPSKLLIASADVVMNIRNSEKFGIKSKIEKIDFPEIMKYMKDYVDHIRENMRKGILEDKRIDFYEGECYFVDDYTIKVNNKKIKGKKIFIACGARPLIPPIKNIENIDYLTNESLLDLKEIPKSMVIIGGGYIASEYAHFFDAMGTEVKIVEMGNKLVASEEPEISELLKEEFEKRMKIHLNTKAIEVVKKNGEYCVKCIDTKTKKEKIVKGEKILLASGRKPNSDILKVENTGVETDNNGFIKINEYFETTKQNIWAFGDVIGKQMFTHVSRAEADLVWHNSMHKPKQKFDYSSSPHAVFTYPEIAAVGLKEQEAKNNHKILVGKAFYKDVSKGAALREKITFAKAIVERDTYKILGFHIIGPYASVLIQEVINAMAYDGKLNSLAAGMRIHPAMTELIADVFNNLNTVD
ncbi:MAG: dihydrolipoyl dehydrogenase [Candidatus Nanoarchaeia archaeon]|nr:dihydrolipoyl dehydrogenase [Candidatus Nanoarchaeia archaeon]